MAFSFDLLLLMTFDASSRKDAGKPGVEEDEDAIMYMKGMAFVPLHEGLGAYTVTGGSRKKIWNNILLSLNMLNLEGILCKPCG